METPSLTKIKRLSAVLDSVGRDANLNPNGPQHSQFGKNVILRLYLDGVISGNIRSQNEFIFPVNPEEFTVSRNERVQVVQTLGEPFIDEFGIGLPTLSIRGITGWRTRRIKNQNIDGHEAFRRLHRDFIDRYFAERQKKQADGHNPDDVKLVVVNSVDSLTYQVVPQNFRLLRSRVKPLLYQYDLTFVVVADLNGINKEAVVDLDPVPKSQNWLSGLKKRVGPMVAKLESFTAPICQTMAAFIGSGVSILENAKSGVGEIADFLGGVTDTVKLTLDAIRDTQSFINALPLDAIIELNELTSVVGEFGCYLKEGITESWLPDFSGVCGITNCAATHGIQSGTVADSPANAIEWIVALNEASKANGSGDVIGIVYTESNLQSAFEQPNTPIVIDSTLGKKLQDLAGIAQDTSSISGVDAGYDAILDTMGTIEIQPELMVEADTDEDLKKISQFKSVTVKPGETLQSIAFREYGDISRWYEIAAANDVLIENAKEASFPYTSFIVNSNLYGGSRVIELALSVPRSYAKENDTLLLKDSLGKKQALKVESIVTNTITFHDTFSQNFTAPITVTRQLDLTEYGILDGETNLAVEVVADDEVITVVDASNIYPGYNLLLVKDTESRVYTVKYVDYLTKEVTTTEPCIAFPNGAEILIFNTETSQTHLVPGTHLKIPVVSGDKGNIIQTASEVYGQDVKLKEDGTLSIQNGGIEMVSGLDNLKQAITHRVKSDYKSLSTHPRYGCGLLSIIGEKNTAAINTLARASIIEAINFEPRLDYIRELTSFAVGDAIKFSIQVDSIETNTPTDLNFVIGGK